MEISRDDLRIARVLHEDDAFMTLEVVTDEHRELKIEDGDAFLTLLFLKADGDGMVVWKPWEK